MSRRLLRTVAVVAVVSLLASTAAWGQPARSSELVATAYQAAFNLDHREALDAARQLVALEPDESRSHRVMAAVLWTDILFRIGAVTVDNFLGSLAKSKDTRPEVPASLEQEFLTAVARAIELAEARRKREPANIDAQYEVGASYAIEASYRASIEGGATAAFGPARRAYSAVESVLERAPDHPNASVIAGTYRYAVSGLRFPSRWLAYLAGFGGGRERGIAMVESAAGRPDAVYDALPALLMIYTREGRHDEALLVATRLADSFPRNRFFVMEMGAANLRAGRPRDAERVLADGLSAFERDPRPKAPGERALWLYKHAAALVELGRPAEAGRQLTAALAASPLGWIRGRIHLERGKVADLGGHRADAIEAYELARSIAARDNDPIARDAAAALLNQPYRRPDGR